MSKKILAIVEGEKKEPELLHRLLDIYSIHDREIISYRANLYDLYDKLIDEYSDDIDDIDLQQFLLEQNLDPNKKTEQILNARYTDILLVFDFDPQDNRYQREKIIRLLEIFSDSTQMGRLYLNYPMVESFFHFRSLEDNSFLKEMFTLEEISSGSKYKKRVNDLTCIHQLSQLNKNIVSKMIKLILLKIQYILAEKEILVETMPQILLRIAQKQTKLLADKEAMYVLNTCVLYVYEYNPRMLEWLERK